MYLIFRRSSNNVKTYGSDKIVKEMYVGKRRMVEYNSLIISTSIILHYTLEVWGTWKKRIKSQNTCFFINVYKHHKSMLFSIFCHQIPKATQRSFQQKTVNFTPESDTEWNPEVKSEAFWQDIKLWSCLWKLHKAEFEIKIY